MGKLHGGLVAEARKKQEEASRQTMLREKYDVAEDVRIVEKNNFTKFFINLAIRIVKGTAAVILCSLAVVGLLCVLHPDIQPVLLEFFREIIAYIK